jgi:hypothetical protein
MTRLFTLAALLAVSTACVGGAYETAETSPSSPEEPVLADVLATCAATYSVAAGVAHDRGVDTYVEACARDHADAPELCDPDSWLTGEEATCVAGGLGFPMSDATELLMAIDSESDQVVWLVRTPSVEHAGFVDELAISVYGEVLWWESEQEQTDDCRAVADCG